MKLGLTQFVAMLIALCGPLALLHGCGAAPPPPPHLPPPDRQELYMYCEEHVVAPTEDGGVDVRGRPCAKDSDCPGGFCDRGVCAWPTPGNYYGLRCSTTARFTRESPYECAGYLCLAGLCRSCESDAECHRWAGPDTTCMPFGNWPGKQCGTIHPVRVCPNGNSIHPDWWYEPGTGIRPPVIDPKPAPRGR
ncbi:hypothetical protein [Polyangium spumosum]|uniref:Uncharacterized protein n=1 Tax=Polyangium spumosum TaxID=889282 RepID=A0A6N7PN51_9BACT|nr:hypothetical protein [Polyangium spumosum]MRG93177.1 hypothetical protein [Polyangium spumosum]